MIGATCTQLPGACDVHIMRWMGQLSAFLLPCAWLSLSGVGLPAARSFSLSHPKTTMKAESLQPPPAPGEATLLRQKLPAVPQGTGGKVGLCSLCRSACHVPLTFWSSLTARRLGFFLMHDVQLYGICSDSCDLIIVQGLFCPPPPPHTPQRGPRRPLTPPP